MLSGNALRGAWRFVTAQPQLRNPGQRLADHFAWISAEIEREPNVGAGGGNAAATEEGAVTRGAPHPTGGAQFVSPTASAAGPPPPPLSRRPSVNGPPAPLL